MKELKIYQAEQFEFERLSKMFDEIYNSRTVNNRTDSAILATGLADLIKKS